MTWIHTGGLLARLPEKLGAFMMDAVPSDVGEVGAGDTLSS